MAGVVEGSRGFTMTSRKVLAAIWGQPHSAGTNAFCPHDYPLRGVTGEWRGGAGHERAGKEGSRCAGGQLVGLPSISYRPMQEAPAKQNLRQGFCVSGVLGRVSQAAGRGMENEREGEGAVQVPHAGYSLRNV